MEHFFKKKTADHFETNTGGREGGRGRYGKRHKKLHIETNKYNINGTQERKQMFFKVLSMDTTFLIPWAYFSLHSEKAKMNHIFAHNGSDPLVSQ